LVLVAHKPLDSGLPEFRDRIDPVGVASADQMGMVQVVAGAVCVAAAVSFGWTSTRLTTYPAPWSLPWQTGSRGGLWPLFNAAIRFAALAGVTAVVTWPYFQGGHPVWGTPPVGGWGLMPPPIQSSGDLTWLLIVLAAAGAIAVGLAVLWLLPALSRQQRIALTPAPVEDGKPTLSELAGETLQSMMSDRDPRRAILACYAQMERGLAIRGVPRSPEETALEYMRRVLHGAGASDAPLRSLTGLFHIAGFSAQPMDESMRETAIRDLRAISAGAP
jgi:Domain of unknown function (DUF4129)